MRLRLFDFRPLNSYGLGNSEQGSGLRAPGKVYQKRFRDLAIDVSMGV